MEPGRNEHTLAVRRRCGVILVLRDGAATIPWVWEWEDPEAEAVGGAGEADYWTEEAGRYYLGLSDPGRYRLRFPPIPGYRPVPPREHPPRSRPPASPAPPAALGRAQGPAGWTGPAS